MCGQVVLLTTHHLLIPRSWKSRAIHLPNFWAITLTLPFYLLIILQSLIYGSLEDLIRLFKIPLSTPKDLFEICKQIGHAPSKIFANPNQDTLEKVDCS